MRSVLLLAGALAISLLGCSASGVSNQKKSVACYQTAHGMVCLSGDPGDSSAEDADGDGVDDPFVCGDTESDSEGDSADSSNDGDDGDDHGGGKDDDKEARTGGGKDDDDEASDSDGESDSASNEACDEHSQSDGDGDGVPNGTDCDCGGTTPPPPTPPTPPAPPEGGLG
jgi:hypothetical protein